HRRDFFMIMNVLWVVSESTVFLYRCATTKSWNGLRFMILLIFFVQRFKIWLRLRPWKRNIFGTKILLTKLPPMRKLLLGLTLAIAITGGLSAQVTTSSISGKVMSA